AWQARPRTPVVREDDDWAEGRRLARADVARLVRGLGSRDRALLALLGEHGYLTTEDLQALLFSNLRAAQRRLRKLRPPIIRRDRHGTVVRIRNADGLGLVLRWSRTPAGSWVKLPAAYLLRQKGALVLAAIRDLDAAGTQRLVQRAYNAAYFATQLDHDLGVTGFFAALARESRMLHDQGLDAWMGEAAMRRRYQERGGEQAPAPDGWGRYLAGGREVTFQLEWDRSTEPPSALTAKARGYGAFYKRLPVPVGEFNHVLWVADREPRERSIRQAVDAAKPDARHVSHWTTTAEQLLLLGVLGVVWQPMGEGTRKALPQLPGRPNAGHALEDCLGRRGWWERRPVTGEGL
ncbi:MAG: replication-relaxation family protein, partial [Candidatus Dormibacteraeota bacterium]|nr:replication-relaxation family protein [Candidatus Dormibacteraeota bacterium]